MAAVSRLRARPTRGRRGRLVQPPGRAGSHPTGAARNCVRSCRVAVSDRWRPLAEALLGTIEFTSGDVARAAGVALDDARRLWQALGFPRSEEHTSELQSIRQ